MLVLSSLMCLFCCGSPQVGSGGEDEEDGDASAVRLCLCSCPSETLPLHSGQTRLPELW